MNSYQYTIPPEDQFFIPPAGDYNYCACRSLLSDNEICRSLSGYYDCQSDEGDTCDTCDAWFEKASSGDYVAPSSLVT